MPRPGQFKYLSYCVILAGLLGYSTIAGAHRSLPMSGRVIDTDGHPVSQMAVSVVTYGDHGAKTITVYTDTKGAFAMPSPVALSNFERPPVQARKIGYEQVGRVTEFLGDYEAVFVTLTMNPVSNQAAVAPASAWLVRMDEAKRFPLIRKCATCHQMPAPEVRNYARLIADSAAEVEGADLNQAGVQSWDMIQRYMHALAGEEIVHGARLRSPTTSIAEADDLPGENVDPQISATLTEYFVGSMDQVLSYNYGAPLLATPQTVLRGYLTQSLNTGNQVLMAGTPPRLWVSTGDASEKIIVVDLESGQPVFRELPKSDPVSKLPHTLQRDAVGNLWIIPHMNSIIGLYDPDAEEWIREWNLQSDKADPIAISSLSIGSRHEVLADNRGRIWFFDNYSDSFGSFSPATGDTKLFPIPGFAGQQPAWSTTSAGLVMSSDGKQVWLVQADRGRLIMINTETHEFKTVPLPGVISSPVQVAMSDDDVLFVPLFETGQLFEYDSRTDKQRLHDLPDRASAPLATTFDPVRRVIWITTANGGLIYRFDLDTREFSFLPLPHQVTRLQTIAVDPVSNMLVAAYVDARARIKGPGMVMTIDPGDGLVPVRTANQTENNTDAD